MKKYSYIVLIFCLQLLISCEKDANLEIPGYTPKLVVHSFISPDDTVIKVHVNSNRNVFGKKIEYPISLPVNVTLFDEEKEMKFSSPDSGGFCSLKYKIMPGKAYKILVECPGYQDASAVCKVPSLKNFSIDIDTLSEYIKIDYDPNYPKYPGSPDGYYDQKIILNFLDTSGEKNYYNISLLQTNERFYGINTGFLYPINQDNDNYFNYNPNKILSDNLIDGKPISLTFRNYYTPQDTGLYSFELNAFVLETDQDYYKYHTSLLKYSGTEEPFTEFSPIYSNISGGLGIFASYVKYNKFLKLK